jgi:hypothetical protein
METLVATVPSLTPEAPVVKAPELAKKHPEMEEIVSRLPGLLSEGRLPDLLVAAKRIVASLEKELNLSSAGNGETEDQYASGRVAANTARSALHMLPRESVAIVPNKQSDTRFLGGRNAKPN